MNYIGKFVSGVRGFYSDMNSSNLNGSIDVIVIYDEETQKYSGSPFHVKFGKLSILQAKKRKVEIKINEEEVDLFMTLGKEGQAFFQTNVDCDCDACCFEKNQELFDHINTLNIINDDSVEKRTFLSDTDAYKSKDFNIEIKNKPLFLSDEKEKISNDYENFNQESLTPVQEYSPLMSWNWGQLPIDCREINLEEKNSPPLNLVVENNLKVQIKSSIASPLSFDETVAKKIFFEIRMSLCGSIKSFTAKPNRFDELVISFEVLSESPEIIFDKDLVVEIDSRYYPWTVAAPIIVSNFVFGKPLPKNSVKLLKENHLKKFSKSQGWLFKWRDRANTNQIIDNSSENEPKPVVENVTTDSSVCLRKVLKLDSDSFAKLPLKEGVNTIQFSVTSRFQGTVTLYSRIFLWKSTDIIVISDIDGTITKSDMIGHMSYFVGKEWVHSGITKILSKIKQNGYKVIYLSSRAIGIANMTRSLIQTVNKDQVRLPEGPILLSPSSLIQAIHTEIIIKKPEIFKTGCLNDIKSLFPINHNPFHAGFGNRKNDAVAYCNVGIPTSKIFIVNASGEVSNEYNQNKTMTYESILGFVDYIFPPNHKPSECEIFSDNFYWSNNSYRQ